MGRWECRWYVTVQMTCICLFFITLVVSCYVCIITNLLPKRTCKIMYLQPLLQVYNVFFYLVLYVCYITFKGIFFLIEKRIQKCKTHNF
ncbi:hypothetical protein FKM82_010656 [Ascaphus truei]